MTVKQFKLGGVLQHQMKLAILVLTLFASPDSSLATGEASSSETNQVKLAGSFVLAPNFSSHQAALIEQGCRLDTPSNTELMVRGIQSLNLEALFIFDACSLEIFIADAQLGYATTAEAATNPALKGMLVKAYSPKKPDDPDYVTTLAYAALDKAKLDGRLSLEQASGADSDTARDAYAYWRAIFDPLHDSSKLCRRFYFSDLPLRSRYARLYLYYKLFDFSSEAAIRGNATLARLLARSLADSETLVTTPGSALDETPQPSPGLNYPRTLASCQEFLLSIVKDAAKAGDALSYVALVSLGRRTSSTCGNRLESEGNFASSVCTALREVMGSIPPSESEKATSSVINVVRSIGLGHCRSLSCSRPSR